MCYALLSTCSLCTWLHTVTYPRCSHARAYAIPPPACPHRMQRRSKPDGLCEACKIQVRSQKPTGPPIVPPTIPPPAPKPNTKRHLKPPSEKKEQRRKESLSITPCEVRIQFRDTEIGVVEERDKARNVVPDSDITLGKPEPSNGGKDAPNPNPAATRRTRRPRPQIKPLSIQQGASDEDTDADMYIDSASTTASISTTPSFTSDDSGPRNRGPRSKPQQRKRTPQRSRQKQRSRSPSVLERLHTLATPASVKKGRRGRPPKQKIMWPDRIDAGAFDQMVEERNRVKGRVKKAQGRPAKQNRTAEPRVQGKEVALPSTYFEKSACGSVVVEKWRPEYRGGSQGVVVGGVGMIDGESEARGDDLARIIALEASRRDKKWR